MDKLFIKGGNRLNGTVKISGAKNAAIAAIPAAILVDGKCTLENIPNIQDVKIIVKILTSLGSKITYINANTIEIDNTLVNTHVAVDESVKKMRASYYLLGALLGRFGKAEVLLPGGCNFGSRPIDQHIKGFAALNVKTIISDDGIVKASTPRLTGGQVYLDVVSVGATINVMLAAVKAEGVTVIENAAKEPHIVDTANFLNAMGANIKGAGTDVIKIKGVKHLKGGLYSIIPDQIEAGTYMMAAAATGGDVIVEDVIPKHLESISAKLEEMGVIIEELDDKVRVISDGNLKCVNVKTMPYPGFPTDMQPQVVMLLSVAKGKSMVNENVWESRFQYVGQLINMGAKIDVNGKIATITGVDKLKGAVVHSTDLRAAAALLIAGLVAEGTTEIDDLTHIDRGYEDFTNKLLKLGANIKRVKTEEQVGALV